MLFAYRYVPHTIGTLQAWLDHLVKEVWCKAIGDYSLDSLHPDLRAVVEEIFYDGSITKDHLDGPIKAIYALFRDRLTAAQRRQVSDWYDANNDIEALCANDPAKTPATYVDLAEINVDLARELKTFCGSLWSDVMHLKAVQSRIGAIDEHYQSFVAENDEGKCPYCGLSDIKGEHHSKREAYDHFLPKGTYPFVSVNFRNLAPMCHECNSSYKLAKDATRHLDPITRRATAHRRKAFYTYADDSTDITISLTLKSTDIGALRPTDIGLQVTAAGRGEEVEAWMDVFGIEERYKAKCCAKNDGKYWLVQALDECANDNKTSAEILAKIERNAEAYPWAECNFLKRPFLRACRDAGLV